MLCVTADSNIYISALEFGGHCPTICDEDGMPTVGHYGAAQLCTLSGGVSRHRLSYGRVARRKAASRLFGSNLFGVAEIPANLRLREGLLPRIDNRDTGPPHIPVVSGDEHQIMMQSSGRQETVDNRHRPAFFGGNGRQRAPSLRDPLVYC